MADSSAPAPAAPRATRRHRTPTVLQMEAVECGAAALGIVLAYHGRITPLEELRLACGVSRDGAKASNVVRAARTFGFVAKGYRKDTVAELAEMPLPAIVFWNFNHFLVVEGFARDRVYLNDPATGPRTVTLAEFEAGFTGVVLTLEPGSEFKPGGAPRSLVASLRARLRGSEHALIFVVLVSLLLVVPGLVVPAFSRVFVDDVLGRGRVDWLGALLLGLVLTAVGRGALTWLQQHALLRLETKLAFDVVRGVLPACAAAARRVFLATLRGRDRQPRGDQRWARAAPLRPARNRAARSAADRVLRVGDAALQRPAHGTCDWPSPR